MNKIIKLSDIIIDAGTQVRASISESTVEEYSEAYRDKVKFPAWDVFADGNKYLLADGFHRFMGAQRAGLKEHVCNIHSGTRADCIKFALGCNINHGLRRTNADKRHAVELALAEFPKLSDIAISEMCGVNRELVGSVRHLLESSRSQTTKSRIGRDGIERKLPPPVVPVVPKKSAPPIVIAPPKPPTVKSAPVVPVKPAKQEVEVRRDSTGHPIPESLFERWDRATEWQGVLSQISAIKGILRRAQETNDITAVEINFSSAISHLDQVYADVKTAKPFAVCTTCQGKVTDQCLLCKGKGFISEFRWDTVPRETKELRAKLHK